MKFAIIGGSGVADLNLSDNVIFLKRHGDDFPPHMVNHKKNILKLKNAGITHAIGVFSVGSLKKEIVPGTIVIPDDYINLWGIQSFFDDVAEHIGPSLDDELRKKLIFAAKNVNAPLQETGIYFQTRGPRFETKAEIRMLSNYADVVGMTMANEATLAKEQGLKYAAVCIVDNYGNGLSDEVLSMERFKELQKQNFSIAKQVINSIIESIK